MSSYNPFRTPVATPNPTGASASSTVPPSYTSAPPPSFSGPPRYSDDDDESPEVLPELTPRIPSGRPSQLAAQNTGSGQSTPPFLPPRPSSSPTGPPLPSNRSQTDDVISSTDGISESAPPAYSLTPDVGGGELVVEQGPRRPFQRAPEPLLQLSTPPSQQQQQHLQPPQPQPPQFVPPSGPPPSRPGRPNSQLSDFAQDFYNNSGGASTSPPAAQQQPQQPRYAPPPGPPPPRRPRAASTSSGAGSTAPPASDGRPTTTPTPGHPLLRNGKTLVYPENYLCQKCTFRTSCPTYCSPTVYGPKTRKGQNTGYKNYDPSHPCRKCWDRFSKPFTSALASSPWGDHASGSGSQSQHNRTYQRPLPAFKPPQAQAQMPGHYPPRSPTGVQSPNSRPIATPYGGVPPPGSTVVLPGDPRIGGRLCWRCGGRGTTPFLIFDEMTCETCGGIGRLVN